MHIIHDPNSPQFKEHMKRQNRGRIAIGIVIIGIGITLLLHRLGYYIPNWVLSWKMLLIVIGLAIGVKHKFHRPGWIVPVLIGFTFILGDLYPDFVLKPLLLPVIFIGIGAYMIFRPSRRCDFPGRVDQGDNTSTGFVQNESSSEDTIDITAVFGGVKKNIISNNFKGGEINSVFGGSEINLMQCDFTGKITIEANQVLGGTKLIIPSNWQIQSESVAVLGGIEDKRPVGLPTDPNKILVLKGTSVLGGLEILSYA